MLEFNFPNYSERNTVLRQIGLKFYKHCSLYTELLGARPIIGDIPVVEPGKDQRLLDFSREPGSITEYTNQNGCLCSISQRLGHEGWFEFTVSECDREEDESEGDILETYLIDNEGSILVAERRITSFGIEEGYVYERIELEPELLLARIATEFQPLCSEL